jgi:hypothetical protein
MCRADDKIGHQSGGRLVAETAILQLPPGGEIEGERDRRL